LEPNGTAQGAGPIGVIRHFVAPTFRKIPARSKRYVELRAGAADDAFGFNPPYDRATQPPTSCRAEEMPLAAA
jgi:hypothetical protein